MKETECFECGCGFPLEYHPGYGWYHHNPFSGPDTKCTNPEVVDLPNPEDCDEE